MEVNPSARLEFWRGDQQFESRVNAARDAKFPRSSQAHAAMKCRMFDARKVHRRALTCNRAVDVLAAGLHATHAQAFPIWEQFHLIFRGHASRTQVAGTPGTTSLDAM